MPGGKIVTQMPRIQLRAEIIIECEAVDFVEAASHQSRLTGALAALKPEYPTATLSIRDRRSRGRSPSRPEPAATAAGRPPDVSATPPSCPGTLFRAIEAMRAASGRLTLRQAIAFLCICESEGLSLQELAFVSRLSKQTASLAVKFMAAKDSEHQAAPLLRLEKHPSDARLLQVFLDDGGRSLRDEINAAILEPQTVVLDEGVERRRRRA